MPEAAFQRLQTEYSLSARDAGILVALGEGIEHDGDIEDATGEGSASVGVTYFERVANGRESKTAANWSVPLCSLQASKGRPHRVLTFRIRAREDRVIHELLGQLTKNGLTLLNNPIKPEELGQLVDAVTENRMTGLPSRACLVLVRRD